jgi:hypothetical protein
MEDVLGGGGRKQPSAVEDASEAPEVETRTF